MSDVERTGQGPGDPGEEFGPFARGIAIGVVLVLLVWVCVALVRNGSHQDNPAGVAARVGDTHLTLPPNVDQRFAPTRMDRCTAAADRLAAPLHAARTTLDQWAIHVGAMNKLVVGAITLPQATAFWNQTRVGADQRIKRFFASEKSLVHHGVDCPPPAMTGTGSSRLLQACSQHVAAMQHELQTARTAIATWRGHVLDMNRLRRGTLSPTLATQMWLAMWQRGTHELDTYRSAAGATHLTRRCGVLPRPSSTKLTTPPSHPSATPMQPMPSMH